MVVCCKPNARKSVTSTSPDYRYKEKYPIRRLTLIDKEDTDGTYIYLKSNTSIIKWSEGEGSLFISQLSARLECVTKKKKKKNLDTYFEVS